MKPIDPAVLSNIRQIYREAKESGLQSALPNCVLMIGQLLHGLDAVMERRLTHDERAVTMTALRTYCEHTKDQVIRLKRRYGEEAIVERQESRIQLLLSALHKIAEEE
jgi:hypothetical protein